MEKSFDVLNLNCAHCGAKIEEALNKFEEIELAVLNYPLRKLKIKGEHSDELLARINETAKGIEAGVEIVPSAEKRKAHSHEHEECECEHEHEHHHHDHEECECEHEHEHHHHDHEECECEHEHEHHHHNHEECECEHEHEHHHHHEKKQHSHSVKGKKYEFNITELDCAHCGAKIEAAVSKIEGITSAQLNYPLKKLVVTGNVTPEIISLMNETAQAIEAGVELVPVINKEQHSTSDLNLKKDIFLFAAGAVLFAAAILLHKLTSLQIPAIVMFAGAYLILGSKVLVNTFKNVKAGNLFDENFLMTIATLGAFALGEYEEAVGVVLFFRIGEMFEDYAVSKSRKAITDVADLKVDEADVLRNGSFQRIPSEEIQVGDILRIKSGERIAADGIILSGDPMIDTSAINGEPVPVILHKGDRVMSGCIGLNETFTMKAEAAADDSMIAKIARAVEDASAGKPKIDRFITRFSKIYTPIVIAAALLTGIIGSVVTGDWQKWIYTALTFLVISCPCALVLSVPLAYFSGIGASSKLGILFKGGAAIEALGKVKAVAFDKTGTLTNGSFSVTDISLSSDLSEYDLLKICGSCEQSSTHPVAASITDYCRENNITFIEPQRLTELPGRGVEAVLDGKIVLCGNEKLMEEKNAVLPPMQKPMIGSVVYVAINGSVIGRIVVSDTIRNTSADAAANLKKMGIFTALLTGDKQENADAVGKKLGIDLIKGGLMPQDKLTEIKSIRESNGAVLFVGDGINDGPVLAGADVGGAMHSGSDLALEAADAVFMNSEPDSIVKAKKIADKTLRISYENITFALAVKAAVLLLGLFGHPNMWLAVFADSGTAMLLILNSIRALSINQYTKN